MQKKLSSFSSSENNGTILDTGDTGDIHRFLFSILIRQRRINFLHSFFLGLPMGKGRTHRLSSLSSFIYQEDEFGI